MPHFRKLCFPSESSKVEFIPKINGFEQIGDCGYDVCGDDIPDEYQVLGAGHRTLSNLSLALHQTILGSGPTRQT